MPYAYGATITHEFNTDHLHIWLTFRHPMDINLKPPLAKWILEEDGNAVDIVDSDWSDEFTMLLESDTIAEAPLRVTLEYDGPDSNLQTTWEKDWEPWGPILSTDIGRLIGYVNRGDPAAYDWSLITLDADEAWHDLDLSGIIPEGTAAVSITVLGRCGAVDEFIYLSTTGFTNMKNRAELRTQVAGVFTSIDMVIAPDADRKIKYAISVAAWDKVYIMVKGWWF